MDIDESFYAPDLEKNQILSALGHQNKSEEKSQSGAEPMVLVKYQSPPAKKERKFELKPLVI